MPKVTLPRADWDWVIIALEDAGGYLSPSIIKDINDQLDKQEY